jgi:hypothetical protein
MATAEQIKALLKSHADRDDQRFYSIALQVATKEARQGHHKLANELKALVLLCHIYPVVCPEKWYNFAMSTSIKISKGMYLKIPPKINSIQRDSI